MQNEWFPVFYGSKEIFAHGEGQIPSRGNGNRVFKVIWITDTRPSSSQNGNESVKVMTKNGLLTLPGLAYRPSTCTCTCTNTNSDSIVPTWPACITWLETYQNKSNQLAKIRDRVVRIIGPGATRELNLQPTNIKYRPAWSKTYFSKVISIIANLDNY